MSGKAYTMKEMKAIVEYLVEHKAYGLIRGRKMWMDFSNSSSTSRSWQSLKETFLKRILPDIHNPYYKLSKEQIRSFRSGTDVEETQRNKLEMQTLSDDSGSNAVTPNGNEKPSTSKQNGEEKAPGEDIPSKINSRNRSSVDTVILDTCYETAEDVLRDLECNESCKDGSPNNEEVAAKSPCKSLRDLITYSEPLTPMLQEVLHDFETDDESDSGEPKMQIVENVPESDEHGNESPRRIPDPINECIKEKENEIHEESNAAKDDSNEPEKFIEPKVKSLRLRKRKGVYVPVAEPKPSEKPVAAADKTETSEDTKTSSNENNVENTSEPSVIIVNDSDEKTVHKLTTSNAQSTQNCSNSTTDTVLPNNQEALDSKKAAGSKNESSDLNKTDTKVDSLTRRRTVSCDLLHSQETNNEKKSNLKQTPTSDTDTSHEKVKSDTGDITNASETIEKHKETTAAEDQTRKSSEIDTQDILPPNKTAKELNTSTPASQVNPCLQSVSLFAEQFNLSNYLDSESSNDVNPLPESTRQSADKPVTTIEMPVRNDAKEVVILKSHSDTESDTAGETTKKKDSQVVPKSKRDKVLANMFGFSSGAVTSKRKRLPSYRKNVASHHYHGHNSSGESSEWTSESDSDYVSPPRGRRNRQARKYLKPKSARIHSLEDEGGLFVMYGKKIYPLVKDGRTIKNYLVYSPGSDPDDEENYWKQKYVEERKRVEELKKVLKHNKNDDKRDSSPLLPLASTKPSRTQTASLESRTKSKAVAISDSDKDVKQTDKDPKEEKQQKAPVVATNNNKTLKITFAKNNQEVHLEGHWSQLHPVLADVVEIFHKDTNASESSTKKSEPTLPEVIRNKSPVVLTPIDPDVHEKVNKLETEIFKEIEERDQEEETETKDPVENNVTKRKRPNRPVSTTTEESNAQDPSPDSSRSLKRAKKSNDTAEVNKDNVEQTVNEKEAPNKEEQKGIETPLVIKPSKASVTSRKTRTPKKEQKGTETRKAVASNEVKPTTRKSKLAVAEEVKKSESDDESEIRYMFPPAMKSAKTSVVKTSQPTKRYSINIRSIFSPPGSSQHSESTQGYQDSDVSPPKLRYRRKRRLSLSTVVCKNKNKQNRMRRSLPIISNEHSSDSNNSYHIILKPPSECSSLKSDEYRSESYQMLMANRRNIILKPLEKIEEDSPTTNNDFEIRNLDNPSNSELVKSKISINITNNLSPASSNANPEGGNSSSVSLPLSPELSIVENLSVSKELVKRLNDHPTLNELHLNNTSNSTAQNKYLISQVDVSMPLMQQQCGVYRNFDENLKSECTFEEGNKPAISESLLDKINTVNIKDNPSMSDSLDTRLKNLLLESAKKISDECNNDTPVNKEEITVKKSKPKRCSTPRKKKESQPKKLTKALKVDPVIEEECMAFCSSGGRKSCPPSIHVINNETDITDIIKGVTANKQPKDKSKVKIKKDIIKVKITRPSKDKKRKSSKENTPKRDKTINRASISINRETNDNESGISSQDFSDGIDLIHNHSETCLQANECIGDSVEFLEMTAKSIISVNSNTSGSCGCTQQKQLVFQDCEDISLFCNNAQDGSTPYKIKQFVSAEASGETVYHSPNEMSQNSLITEDLSDEVRSTQSTKWYLLSEDETNTNGLPQNQNSFGAHLKQLFPITCAVPDLSTITEMSKEDDSRKPTLEGYDYDSNTMNDINSQSIFDIKL